MSDDIVIRLRRDCMSLIADEAADEIERLREDLEETRMLLGQMEEDYFRIREHNERD